MGKKKSVCVAQTTVHMRYSYSYYSQSPGKCPVRHYPVPSLDRSAPEATAAAVEDHTPECTEYGCSE